MTRTTLDDPMEQADLQRAFEQAKPPGAPVVPEGKTSMEITDGVITARRVEVARDEAKIIGRIKALAAAAGTDWFYRFPVWNAKKGRQDFIEGPSIKLANAIVMLYGNCAVDCRIVDLSSREWMIYAKFIDYERGVSLVRPWLQDKGAAKLGGDDEGRKLNIALQIGVSKAERNAICNGLQILSDFAFEEAQKNLVERIGKNVEQYRARAIKWFADNNIDIKRIETVMGRTAKEWMAPDLARIAAEVKAVEDGMASAQETWPAPAPAEPKRSDVTDVQTEPAATPARKEDAPAGPSAAEATAAPAAASASAPIGAEGSEPPPKNWRLPDNLVGQDAVIKSLSYSLSITETLADVDALEQQNADRIAKITGNRRAVWNDAVRQRRTTLTG